MQQILESQTISMQETPHIRTATQADIPLIQHIARVTWPATFADILSPEDIEHELNREYTTEALKKQMIDGQVFLLLEKDDEVIAYCSYSDMSLPLEQVSDNANYLPTLQAHKLYILPIYQGQGYGHQMMDWIERYGYINARKMVYILVNRQNKAKNFYEKRGFVVLTELNTRHGPVLREDYVMIKELH